MPFTVIGNIILFPVVLLFTSQLAITKRNEFGVVTFSLNEKGLRQICWFEGEATSEQLYSQYRHCIICRATFSLLVAFEAPIFFSEK